MCGSGERSATASRTTIVRNPDEHASTAVARMQPLVLAPAISTVSTRCATSRLVRSVAKNADGYFFHTTMSCAQRPSRSSNWTPSPPSSIPSWETLRSHTPASRRAGS